MTSPAEVDVAVLDRHDQPAFVPEKLVPRGAGPQEMGIPVVLLVVDIDVFDLLFKLVGWIGPPDGLSNQFLEFRRVPIGIGADPTVGPTVACHNLPEVASPEP